MTSTRFVSPKGFPEYLPAQIAAFNHLKNTVYNTYRTYGFEYIETPAVEYLDTLASSGDISKEIYAITRAKGEGSGSSGERALRFDLTTPFARYVAEHQGHLTFPFRRFQIDRVWRGERPQKGRYRELYQADVDIVAKDSLPLYHDVEVLEVIAGTLDKLDLFDFTIRINDRQFLTKFIQQFGIALEQVPAAFAIIDKLAKVPEEVSMQNLIEQCGISQQQAKDCIEAISKTYSLAEADGLSADFVYIKEGLDSLNLTRGKIVLDLRIVRGLDYYTGFVYETTIDGQESYGSISSGGRYANLASRFSQQSFPGVGGSIGLSRLFFVLLDCGIINPSSEVDGVYIMLLDAKQLSTSRHLAQTLRSKGIVAEHAWEVSKFSKQIKYADSKAYRWIIICEEDGSYTLKNLSTKEQFKSLSTNRLLELLE